ncbi:MAG: SpoIIE family protein phosphatase [Blastococcus sp.]|nr:SpoIIE family protein phosphatase [Blastococcus sp.]
MTRPPGHGVDEPTDELGRLRTQIHELDRALTAIRAGDVDAVVLAGPRGPQVYTLVSADRPYRVIVEEMGDGAVTVSERGIILYANVRLADLIGADRAALLGRDVTELVDPSSADTLSSLLTATPPGTTHQEELELVHADGSAVPVLASVTGLDIEGVVVRCLVLADLTDRRRGEEELAGAYARLSRSAHELEEAQRIGRIGSWFWNAATDEIACSTQIFRILGIDPTPSGTMVRTALAASFHPEDASLATTARERAVADRRPFVIEQRVVQANGDVRQTVTRGEVVSDADGAVAGMRGTTQDVTEQRRAATAVLEARAALLRQTMELAEEHRVKESLQRAVLPSRLPSVVGVELAARYLPADMPSLVGGDWYDAFCLPDGSLAVATGDVVGHDLDAAATMGQVRNALRAYAFSEDSPAEVLARLNRLITGLGDNGLATALFGRLDPTQRMFRWSCGGHPPPLLIGAAGVRLLPGPAGVMLGAVPAARAHYADSQAAVEPDDLLVLYTDGLIERRDRDLDEDFAALIRAAGGLGGQPAETVCSTLMDRLLPDLEHEDDVCLLVLRVLPAGSPRP